MILEIADFRTEHPADFESAMRELAQVIAASPGYRGHTVQRSVETPGRYVLLVRWESVESHMVGFRQSSGFEKWAGRLAAHRDGVMMEHFQTVIDNDW